MSVVRSITALYSQGIQNADIDCPAAAQLTEHTTVSKQVMSVTITILRHAVNIISKGGLAIILVGEGPEECQCTMLAQSNEHCMQQ